MFIVLISIDFLNTGCPGTGAYCASEELDTQFFLLSPGKRKCLVNENCWRKGDCDAFLFCGSIRSKFCQNSLNKNDGILSCISHRCKISSALLIPHSSVTFPLLLSRVLARCVNQKCIRQLINALGLSAFFMLFSYPLSFLSPF